MADVRRILTIAAAATAALGIGIDIGGRLSKKRIKLLEKELDERTDQLAAERAGDDELVPTEPTTEEVIYKMFDDFFTFNADGEVGDRIVVSDADGESDIMVEFDDDTLERLIMSDFGEVRFFHTEGGYRAIVYPTKAESIVLVSDPKAQRVYIYCHDRMSPLLCESLDCVTVAESYYFTNTGYHIGTRWDASVNSVSVVDDQE